MKALLLRNRAIRSARVFFDQRRIIEVRTSKAVSAAAMEPYIDAFSLTSSRGKTDLFLATSPEMAMKKVFAAEMQDGAGMAGIYEIAAVFRDDPATKNHAREFTMVEWYKRHCTLEKLLQETADLIGQLAENLGHRLPDSALKILDLRDLFAGAGETLDFANPRCFADAWLARHAVLPHHLNELDLAIAAFNLLFDEIILPRLQREKGLCAVHGYPEILAAMAYCGNGVAERAEIFLHGVELANAYREEFRPNHIRDRWLRYNEIRSLRSEPPHVLDEDVILALPAMQGVAGVALGLERTIATLIPTLTLGDFR